MPYLQFCPLAKASELLCEKWTLLIIRELLMGGKRFSDFQRGMSHISPTMLTKRLNELTDNGLVVRKKIPDQRGYEYFLTESGKELAPIIQQIGEWGMRWTRNQISDAELDIELLMLYLERSIDPNKLPGDNTTLCFNFSDLDKTPKWWIVVTDQHIDVCTVDPGKEVDIWFNTDLRTMIEIWMGDLSYKTAIRDKKLQLIGPSDLTNHVTRWMSNSAFSEIPAANQI
ncbi:MULTISPECIES: helix-turn-helix domain-containing protein [unclassified Neptuniibacter]|uniref:winged helix-turn-helix transcriptional regulator n=1 Tax=unclassified Neptuniibacter TaxID=2630693 RepID=UPI000C59FC04|nr:MULTISPECIES: helix-turn-helix domain-containing protein [unclassified Neptuniibacter]MAY41200.1 HxlR family transcriptional regulator [Oceanospirillaceae bacterium]|tara:strand:- start:5094 stop:5777 length:684 start_codon:yes stop_codon:yes gene_type:complete